jgi:hypothetical protein
MSRGGRTKQKERVVVVVVERSRLGALCLAEAYEQVIPIVRRAQELDPGEGDAMAGAQRRAAGGTP